MPTKPIERLLFAQGGRCFFCDDMLSAADASIEHLVATTNGGGNTDENCVACCKTLNRLLGRMSLKEKLRVVLNQKGEFKCPNGGVSRKSGGSHQVTVSHTMASKEQLALVLADLQKRGTARPRTVKTLSRTINALFKKQLSESKIVSLVDQLQATGVISVSGTKVSYIHAPTAPNVNRRPRLG
jgi:hypothetical protein